MKLASNKMSRALINIKFFCLFSAVLYVIITNSLHFFNIDLNKDDIGISLFISGVNGVKLKNSYSSNSHKANNSDNKNSNKDIDKSDSLYNYDRNHWNKEKHFLQYQVGLASNPIIKDGPLSDEQVTKAMDDYYYEPINKAIGIVTFSDNIKKQALGKLRINSNNLKLFFPTDKEYQNVSSKAFNNTIIEETEKFSQDKEKLFLLSQVEKPENMDINPYKLLLDKQSELLNEEMNKQDNKKESKSKNYSNSNNKSSLSSLSQYDYSKNNKNKKNLLELSLLKEEKIYKQNLETLKDKNERYNKQMVSPMMKYNMKMLQSWNEHRINHYDGYNNGMFEIIIDNNNDYYKYNA